MWQTLECVSYQQMEDGWVWTEPGALSVGGWTRLSPGLSWGADRGLAFSFEGDQDDWLHEGPLHGRRDEVRQCQCRKECPREMVHAPILPEGVLQLESERKVRRREEATVAIRVVD